MASVVSFFFSNTNFQNTNKIMKTNELRVGNYVLFSGFQTRIKPYDFSTQCRGLNGIEMPNIEPVILTEDCLKNFKATQTDLIYPTFEFDRFELIYSYSHKFWKVVDKEKKTYLTKVEFVHEWQNFVFIMNGSELVFFN